MSIIDDCLALYGSDTFFVRYPARETQQEYWAQKEDPDGKIRDIASERQQRMADIAYIADFINTLPSGHVLDVGCGFGELLEQIAPRHTRIGVDPSEIAMQAVRALDGVVAHQGVLEDLEFAPASCDIVTSHHVIEHLQDPVGFVDTVAALLKPGGYFICGTPNFASPAARVYGDRFRLLHDPTHISLFTDDSLIRLLRHKGFRIVKVEYPFFGTRFATMDACEKMLTGSASVSPAFWGSFVTVFAERMSDGL